MTKEFHLVKSNLYLLDLIRNSKHEDTSKVFVNHLLNESLLDTEEPTDFLTNDDETVNLGEKKGGW